MFPGTQEGDSRLTKLTEKLCLEGPLPSLECRFNTCQVHVLARFVGIP